MGGMVREPEARAALAGGRSAADLAPRLPAANRPGAELVVVETCRQELAGCPHALLDLAPWREALDAWRRAAGLDERLGRRISEGRILYHHKLRIAWPAAPTDAAGPDRRPAPGGDADSRLAPAACLGCRSLRVRLSRRRPRTRYASRLGSGRLPGAWPAGTPAPRGR